LRSQHAAGSLLDVGAGIGALTLELLESGSTEATCVDLAAGSLAIAREEAARRGLAARISWCEGDFVDVAADLPASDIVALDKVVCCYPSFRPLLEAAARHSRRWLALSYPRDRWYVRCGLWLENLWRRLRGSAFRAFVHPVTAMDALLREAGFVAASHSSTLVWQASVYTRKPR
jgi:magnesium-protoporphyrin O-methyltransferase